jgi:hypothetical protein
MLAQWGGAFFVIFLLKGITGAGVAGINPPPPAAEEARRAPHKWQQQQQQQRRRAHGSGRVCFNCTVNEQIVNYAKMRKNFLQTYCNLRENAYNNKCNAETRKNI